MQTQLFEQSVEEIIASLNYLKIIPTFRTMEIPKRFIHVLSLLFSIAWAIFIVSDYLYFHPTYYLSIIHFNYFDLILFLFVPGLISGLVVTNATVKNYPLTFLHNGLGMLLLLLIICGAIIIPNFDRFPDYIIVSYSDVFTYLGSVLVVITCTYVVYLFCYVLGSFLLHFFFSVRMNSLEEYLVSIALGLIVTCVILFLIASIGVLYNYVLLPIFGLILLLFWKRVYHFILTTLIKPFSKSPKISWLGFICFYLTLSYIGLTFLQNIDPIPSGFDASRLYLNVPKLLVEQHGIVAGKSPYYWSLFISLGHVLFNKIEVVISLSISGGILAALTIYAICRKWLSQDYCLLVVLLFFSLPTVNYLSSGDIKNDLGLLFIQLILLLLLINYFYFPEYKVLNTDSTLKKRISKKYKASQTKASKKKLLTFSKKSLLANRLSLETQYIILLGLFSGGALGIKLTSLLLIFSVVVLLFYKKVGVVGFLTSTTLVFSLILIAGLDVPSGLRAYHLSTDWLRWLTLGSSLVGGIYLFFKYRKKMIQLVGLCVIYGVMIFFLYLPWPLKNYSETKTFTFQTFIKGTEAEPPHPE